MARMAIRSRRRKTAIPAHTINYNYCPPRHQNGTPYYGNRNQYTYTFVGEDNPGLVFGTPKITAPYATPGYCVQITASPPTAYAGDSVDLTFSHRLGRVRKVFAGTNELQFRVINSRKIRIQIPANFRGYLVGAANSQHLVLRMDGGWVSVSPGDREGWISIRPRPAIGAVRTRGRR